MILEDILSAIKLAWQMAPFPFLFLALIVAGFAWLWVEYQVTRLLRAAPGWHRPAPLMPGISILSVGVMRLLWALVWVWLALFIVLAVVIGAAQNSPDIPRPMVEGVLSVGRAWNQGYRLLADRLPEGAPVWLRPASVESADFSVPSLQPALNANTATPTPMATMEASARQPVTTSLAPIDTPPSPTPLPAVLATIVSNANVRAQPSTSASSLGIARAGRTYPVTGRNAVSTWIRIDFAGAQGWVYAELVEVEGPLDTVEVLSN